MISVPNQQGGDANITTAAAALVGEDAYKNEEEEEKMLSIYNTQSKSKKLIIFLIISGLGFLSLFDELAYVPALPVMIKEFNTTEPMGILTVAVYLFGMGLAGLLWGVLSDYYGRKPITTCVLGALILSSIGCYFSPNIYVFLVCRGLQGCFVSIALVVGPGTIADIYEPSHRGNAYGIFYGLFAAAGVCSSSIGGQMSIHYGWRSIFILITIISIVLFLSYVLIVPETQQYKVICMHQNQRKVTLVESDQVSKPILKNPFSPLLYLINSKIIPYACVLAFGSLATNCSVVLLSTDMSKPPYSYQENIVGLLYIPLGVAHFLGSVVGGKLADVVAVKCFQVAKILEGRMVPGLICTVIAVIGLTIYGWAVQYGIHSSVPLLGLIFCVFGITAARPGILSYLTIKYQEHSASISSANNFLQSLLSSVGLSFTGKVVQIIYNGPFFTVLAVCNCLIVIVAAVIIYRKFSLSKNPETKVLV